MRGNANCNNKSMKQQQINEIKEFGDSIQIQLRIREAQKVRKFTI